MTRVSSESPRGITHHACQNEQTRSQRLGGAGCVLNRGIRKVIYHPGGKPLTRRRAGEPPNFRQSKAGSNAQAFGTAKAQERSGACREAGKCVGKRTGTERHVMKLNTFAVLIGTSAVVLTGCETPYGTPDRTATGALTGGAIGVASGALLGGRHAGPAALLGGVLGAVAGGLIGHSMDQEAQARLREQAPQTYTRLDQGQPLNLADVKALAEAKVSDEVIISQIRNSRTVFHLSSADIIDLKNSGVDENVIDFMINTSTSMAGVAQASQAFVAETPPPAPVETTVVAPGPGYVWVGGEWVWNGGWVWMAGHWMVPPYPHAIWIHGGWERGPHGYRRVLGHWR